MPIPIRRLRPAPAALLAAALCLVGGPLTVEAQEHTLHVAVADASGNPVPGLTEDDIIVQWDGENLETTEFEAVDWPVRLSVFIDNSNAAVGLVPQAREGLRALLRTLPSEMEIAMLTTARQPRWITRHTTDRAELEENIANIAPDTGAAPTFIDALVEETDRIHDDDREYYPVIIMIAGDGADGSRSQQGRVDRMVERMVENMVELHTVLFVGGSGQGSASMASVIGSQLVPATRGTFDRIAAAPAIVEKLEALGRDIARKHGFVSSQYRITYRQPRNPSPQPAIGVATSREGLQMLPTLDGNVPSRMPQP